MYSLLNRSSTIDTWVTNYGKGHMKFLVGDVATAIDIVGYILLVLSINN